jgi:hypothetical protein
MFVLKRPLNAKLDKSKREMFEIDEDEDDDENQDNLIDKNDKNQIGTNTGAVSSKFQQNVNYNFILNL